MILLLVATFSLSDCMKQATWVCQDVVLRDPALQEAADGIRSEWLKGCRDAAVSLCLRKADKRERFGSTTR